VYVLLKDYENGGYSNGTKYMYTSVVHGTVRRDREVHSFIEVGDGMIDVAGGEVAVVAGNQPRGEVRAMPCRARAGGVARGACPCHLRAHS